MVTIVVHLATLKYAVIDWQFCKLNHQVGLSCMHRHISHTVSEGSRRYVCDYRRSRKSKAGAQIFTSQLTDMVYRSIETFPYKKLEASFPVRVATR
jgi:hypothetical protein